MYRLSLTRARASFDDMLLGIRAGGTPVALVYGR